MPSGECQWTLPASRQGFLRLEPPVLSISCRSAPYTTRKSLPTGTETIARQQPHGEPYLAIDWNSSPKPTPNRGTARKDCMRCTQPALTAWMVATFGPRESFLVATSMNLDDMGVVSIFVSVVTRRGWEGKTNVLKSLDLMLWRGLDTPPVA